MTPVRKYEWRDAGRETKVALVEQAYGSSPILYVTTRILIHELTPAAAAALADVKTGAPLDDAPEREPCWCCGSVYAKIIEDRPDLALFIDRDTGSRVDASRLTAAERAQLEADAEHVEILLRVSRAQLPLLLAPARRHIMASGSMRAGKTQVGAYWLVRQILMRGGHKAQFWIIGETEYDAFRVLQKMLYGDDKAPAILPPVLFTYVPGTERMSLLCKMVDGTLLDLKHLRDPSGGNLKREAVQAILVDEAAEMSTLDQFNTIEGRTITTKGSIFLATTPTPGHFLRTKVVNACAEYQRLGTAAPRKHPGRRWIHVSLSLLDQPWTDPVHTWNEMQAKGGAEDPAVRRDYFGEWISNAGPLFRAFSQDRHVTRKAFRTLQEWDTWRDRDCTPRVARDLFGRDNPAYPGLRAKNLTIIGGMDVNIHPHTTVLLQVAHDPAEPNNRDRWTVFVWDELQTEHGDSSVHASALHGKVFAKNVRRDSDGETYRNIGIIADGESWKRDPTAHRYGARAPKGVPLVFGKLGFDLRPPVWTVNHKAANPHRKDSFQVLHDLLREGRIVISHRCDKLIESLLAAEDDGSGVTMIKETGHKSDRDASAIEALIYPLWAIFMQQRPKPSTLVDAGGMFGSDAAFGSGSAFEDEAA